MLANNELPPSLLPPPALSNYLLDSQHKAFPQATTVELQDIRIPGKSPPRQRLLFLTRQINSCCPHLRQVPSTPSRTSRRSSRTVRGTLRTQANKSDLPPFPDFPKNIKGKGTPQLIILALSGLRCADIVRALKPIKAGGEMAKVCLVRDCDILADTV